MIKILIDGRVLFHNKVTGVENHAISIIEKMEEKIDIDVAIPKYKNRYYSHFWEHFILPIKARKYDILFCPSNIAPLFLSKKIKLVVTLHDLSFKDFSQMYSLFFRKYYDFLVPKILKRADKILTISSFSYKRITKEYPFIKDKINFIYHGKNEIFDFDETIKKEDYILYVGSLNDTKNFSSVIKAFIKLKNSKYKLKMIMPSSSNFKIDENKLHLLNEAKNNKNIEIIDYLSQDKLVKVYQKAKIFVFPSYHESFGFPVLEAFACGTPVICSNTSSLPEVGCDAVLYCDAYDVNDIKEKIELLLADEILQKKMIEKGLKRAKFFSWEKSADEHIKIFKEVLKNDRRTK